MLASDAIAGAARDGPYGFEPPEDANLKGIPEPVPLFRVSRSVEPRAPDASKRGRDGVR